MELLFDHEIILSRGHSINFVNHCRRHRRLTRFNSNHFGIQNIWNHAQLTHIHVITSFHIILHHFASFHIISYHLQFQKSWGFSLQITEITLITDL